MPGKETLTLVKVLEYLSKPFSYRWLQNNAMMHLLYHVVFFRDALAKEIYAHLFAWLISKVNGIVFKGKQQMSVAVLDIFGFEVSPLF